MKDSPVIAIHVRREDYSNHRKTLGLLSLEYFRQSLLKIADQVDRKAVWVFCDDIDWVREEFQEVFPAKTLFVRQPRNQIQRRK